MKNSFTLLCLLVYLSGATCAIAESLFLAVQPITASMFSDRRARDVGDIITILISESSTTELSGETELDKEDSLVAQITSIFFPAASATTTATNALFANEPYLGSRTGQHRGTLPQSNWNSQSEFSGTGDMESSGKVNATVTAMILEVLPNGNFILEGEREIHVDGQTRGITISGIARPEDISAGNSIESRYIASLKISFSGKGPISRMRTPGLLKRIWDFLGPY